MLVNDFEAKKEIGNSILNFREERGFTRVRFMSDLDDISVSLANIENGHSYPGLDFIIEVANKYQVPLTSFVNTGFEEKDMNVPNLDTYTDQELYLILQRVSIEKHAELRNKNRRDFASYDVVNSQWSFMGNLLHNERVKRKCSLQQLSEETDIRIGTLRNIESGSNISSFRTWYRISCCFNTPIDYFLINRLDDKHVALQFLLQDIFSDTTDEEREYLLTYLNLYGTMFKNKKQKTKWLMS